MDHSGRTIVRILYGSHLFGTATPASDFDFKSVYVPCARDILLQRVKGAVSTQRPKSVGERNVAGDVDDEAFSLQRYLGLLAEGQTAALDMLFAPPASIVDGPADEWIRIVAERHRLVTRKSTAFVGYCRQQANKYGIKGSRVAAARAALALLDEGVADKGAKEKLGAMAERVRALTDSSARLCGHMAIVSILQGSGATIDHWEVCERKLSFTASIGQARAIMHKLVDEYGHRALQAESQQGVDWKALSHAVRIGRQAIELLETGRVTLPLPCAAHILAIKQGRLPYATVADEIERVLEEVEAAAAGSTLRDEPDRAWIDDFVAAVYAGEVRAGM